eukprot:UN08775
MKRTRLEVPLRHPEYVRKVREKNLQFLKKIHLKTRIIND